MSREMHRRDQGHVAKQDRSLDALSHLPEGVQKSARFFYGFYSETLKGTYAIANRLRWWMQEDGLTANEARDAMRELMRPERAAEIDTSPKAIAALSAEVAKILRDRREREATERRRKVAEEVGPDAAEVERIRSALADAMNPNPMKE